MYNKFALLKLADGQLPFKALFTQCHYTPLQPISGSCDHPLLHLAHPLGPAPKHSNSQDMWQTEERI